MEAQSFQSSLPNVELNQLVFVLVGRHNAPVEIDWKGIARAEQLVSGGQGENVLTLATDSPVDEQLLNSLIPDEDGEFPNNGGWFAGPGGWLLLIEPTEPVKPSIEHLAHTLEHAGIGGTLTGAKPFRPPAWSRPVDKVPAWQALLGYRQLPGHKPNDGPGWTGDSTLLQRVVGHVIDWAAQHGSQLTIDINLAATFPFDQAAAKTMLGQQARTQFVSAGTGYDKTHTQLREVVISTPANVEMRLRSAAQGWVSTIDELRTAIRTAPLDQLNIAMIGHHNWGDFTLTQRPDYDNKVYRAHPELWDEYTPEPCGIQILTDKQLAKAHNLDDWNTTRLTNQLYLVQAKDLAPWYSQPLAYDDHPDPEITHKARADFGDMVFTHDTATKLGITRTK